mgnify:CR=1 FL=1
MGLATAAAEATLGILRGLWFAWPAFGRGWARRLADKQPPFPALQDAIEDVFNARIGDVSGRGKLAGDMRERLLVDGILPVGGSVAEFTKFQADDIAASGKIIADKKIAVE